MVRGQCLLRVMGSDDLLNIANGDLVVIPHGAAHEYYDDPTTPPHLLDDVLAEVGYNAEITIVDYRIEVDNYYSR